jgi:putative hemolysin
MALPAIGTVDSGTRFGSSFGRPAEGVFCSTGSLIVRLAETSHEVRAAQGLRYSVFFEEGAAIADAAARRTRRDVCQFDRVCDHLIVLDASVADRRGRHTVVGAYRLLRQEVAEANFGFYSANEFQIGPMLRRHPASRFLELGRSCVARDYRNRTTIELLWRGIWAYVRRHRIDAMFGCASFPGTDVAAHALPLSFLTQAAAAPEDWRVAALPGRASVRINSPVDDERRALRALPALIKGYWRLGATFSPEAVVDPCFGATDIFVTMPVDEIEARYIRFFGDDGDAHPKAKATWRFAESTKCGN